MSDIPAASREEVVRRAGTGRAGAAPDRSVGTASATRATSP
jgi:hypothetical protein